MLTPISRLDAVPKYRARAEAQRQTGHTRVPARLQGLTPSVVVVHAPAGTPRRERRAKLQAARAESRARRRAAATATRVAQRAGALR